MQMKKLIGMGLLLWTGSVWAKPLSIQEAVVLALRQNSGVRMEQYQRVADKFALEVAHYHYAPQFALTGSVGSASKALPTRSVTGTISQNLSTGGRVSISSMSTLGVSGSWSGVTTAMLTQPVLRGAGSDIAMITLRNAQDQDVLSRLAYQASLIDILTNVLTQYRQLTQDYNNLKVRQLALAQSRRILREYTLKVQAGQLARINIQQQTQHVLMQALSVKDAETKIDTDRNALMRSLGLKPQSRLEIDRHIDCSTEQLPSAAQAVKTALKHNPFYRQKLVLARMSQRNYQQAQDQSRVRADLIATADSTGHQSAQLQVDVPIGDKTLEAAVVNARVAYQQSVESIRQARDQLIGQVKTSLTNLHDRSAQIKIAQQAVEAERKAYAMKSKAQRAGYASTFELQSQQTQLVHSQTDLINRKVDYLSALSGFHQLMGDTLDKWGVVLIAEQV